MTQLTTIENSATQIIEINGVKLEVDMRYVKKIENYKVGDNIKVLIREYSGGSYKSKAGLIVGFDNFATMPTIIIAYIDIDYSNAAIKFVYFNSETKDIEICPMNEHEAILDRSSAFELLDKEITKKENELNELKMRKSYFFERYGKIFSQKIKG